MTFAFDLTGNQPAERQAKPFLKWAGGKSQLLPELIQRIPKNFTRYWEPFVGGGALFFCLQPPQSTLVDINGDLINAYRVVKDKLDELIADLERHVYDPDYYYRIRNIDRTENFQHWLDVEQASRLIYLNKTCYNGLFRVNSKGQFNVPFGRYKNPKIVDQANLSACSKALQNARLVEGCFLSIENEIGSDDFVYFDPPYAPLSATANFTGYSQAGFDGEMQVALQDLCIRLDKKGVRFMVSNSSAPLILDLYQDFKVKFVYATRAINSKGSKRGKIAEVIVTNY